MSRTTLRLSSFAFALVAALTSTSAAPLDCPDFPFEVSPRDVVIFVPSVGYSLVRKGDRRVGTAELPFEAGTDIYYVAASETENSEMAFALVRTVVVRKPTILSPDVISLSRSGSRVRDMGIRAFETFHTSHSSGPNPSRVTFHLGLGRSNTYDAVASPRIYLPISAPTLPSQETEDTVTATMARMQTNKSVGPEGRCIRFAIFDNRSFASATVAYAATIVALNAGQPEPNDTVRLEIIGNADE